ncbi:hypothetical protein [Frondihabitans sp. PAMC 28766]|uniref:hypothetical protein n=1 Tax=Frondihabitans sp. PAMC 28766 TaxID=1795630 RepID=UPI0012FF6481|nr:hypothetical protein [Frondihabitans sp. PAMC 28766]
MKSKPKRGAKALEPVDPALVEGPVADGLLIARSAASIAVANRIIVRALRENRDFDRGETQDAARDELGNLIAEQQELAERMAETRTKASKSRGRSRHQFDYRREDEQPLAQREAIYREIATRLAALRDDDGYIDDIAMGARDRAWNDIGATIVNRVAAATVVPDRTYDEHRDERLRELLDIDFRALAEADRAK